MVDIPESLLRRSAEAKAKALGVPVEQVLAEMKGEGPPVEVPETEPDKAVAEEPSDTEDAPEPVEEVPPAEVGGEPAEVGGEPEVTADTSQDVPPEEPKEAPPAEEAAAAMATHEPAATTEEPAAAVATEEPSAEITEEPVVIEDPSAGDGASGNGKTASVVSPRPTVPPAGLPEGVRTQRLLTVVKARAIQNVRAEPTDKVNTWPHLMLMEFGALLAITGLLVIMSVIIHSPLLEPANFNATPNPSKAPWYFLGLQELLSYFDPQIAGVMVPLFIGMIGFMMIPYVDKNPSTRPSDRKFAVMLYSIFLAGSATLTIIGVLFRGQGFNFTYPWEDGVFFDDLKDWVDPH
jgi:menaquinol-cytochrome c reductase cytochrome b/c subunit